MPEDTPRTADNLRHSAGIGRIEEIIDLIDKTPDFAFRDDKFKRRLSRILDHVATEQEYLAAIQEGLARIVEDHTVIIACVYCAGGLVVNAGEPGWIVHIVKPEECKHSHHDDAPEEPTSCNCGGNARGNHHRESCPRYNVVTERLQAAQTGEELCAYFYPNAGRLCDRLHSNHVYKNSGNPVAHDFVSPQTFLGRN